MPTTLPRRCDIDTSDPDRACAYLRSTYLGYTRQWMTIEPERFRFRHHLTDGGSFFLARFDFAVRCEVRTDPFGYLLIGQLLGGRARMQERRTEVVPAIGDAFLIAPETPTVIGWDDVDAVLVRLDTALVERTAAELTGHEGGSVRFGLSRASSPERVRHWQELVRYLGQDFCRNEVAYTSPLIHAQTMRLLAATVLETFPNSATAAEPARAGRADARAVRRATAFIESHAAEPIGLTEIAAAARMGTRTVQEAFRRHLDTTPMGYLRELRLERAHRDLQVADPDAGTTVADVAARWGFAHRGRFAVAYRQRYGRSPSETLRG